MNGGTELGLLLLLGAARTFPMAGTGIPPSASGNGGMRPIKWQRMFAPSSRTSLVIGYISCGQIQAWRMSVSAPVFVRSPSYKLTRGPIGHNRRFPEQIEYKCAMMAGNEQHIIMTSARIC